LSGRPSLVNVHATSDVEALLIPPENLRAVMIEEPELGERIMRALILRRVALSKLAPAARYSSGPNRALTWCACKAF
jgi:thioredoxin reductase (NADPH)